MILSNGDWRIRGTLSELFCAALHLSTVHTHTYEQSVVTVGCWFMFTHCQRLSIDCISLLSSVHKLED